MDNRDNQQFSTIFLDIASILALQGDDAFRIRAYRRAAQTLASLSENVRNVAQVVFPVILLLRCLILLRGSFLKSNAI